MKNVVKGLVVLLAVLLVTVGFIPGKIDSGVYSSELTFSQEFRLKSLYLGAYLVSFAYDGDTPTYDFRKDIRPPDWWKQEEARLLSLSDEEFKRELRNNLEKTISQFNPSCMQWNREFLEEIVKEAAPDLYDYINQTYMMKNSKGAQSGLQPANLPSYEPGSNTRTFPAIMYSYLGNAIWGFFLPYQLVMGYFKYHECPSLYLGRSLCPALDLSGNCSEPARLCFVDNFPQICHRKV